MKQKKHTKKRRKSNKTTQHIKLFISFSVLVLTLALGYSVYLSKTSKIIGRVASDEARNNLQLGTFYPSINTPTATTHPEVPTFTPSPTPIPATVVPPASNDPCMHDTGYKVKDMNCTCTAWFMKCENYKCVDYDLSKSGFQKYYRAGANCDTWNSEGYCSKQWIKDDGNGWYCLAKPVVYLYPTKPSFVSVSVKTTGQIVVSDPAYPAGGWKNVWAEPTGKLTYNGNVYRELFYETNVNTFDKPTSGITLEIKDIRTELDRTISKLGLIKNEKTEFLDFWVPRLQALNTPYIQFSVIEKNAKDKIDHVDISPKPDTMIEFIAYFKPISKQYQGPALNFPPTPQRIGFTAVEWGGTIDNK